MLEQNKILRLSAGAIIIKNKQILAFKRQDFHTWQLPQGGVHIDESYQEAALRETEEETSIPSSALKFRQEYPELIAYEVPAWTHLHRKLCGQAVKWFVFDFIGTEEQIIPRLPEFIDKKWTDFDDLITTTSDFKKPGYRHLQHFLREQKLI